MTIVPERNTAHRRQRPGKYLGIAMLPHHISMNMLGIHSQEIAQKRPEAGGIKRGAGSEDPAFRNIMLCRNSGRNVGGNIHRIGGDKQNGFRCIFENLRNDLLKNG